jgi:hypothetical protein
MKIAALDLGNRSGFACGIAGTKPRLESWLLKGRDEPVETACRNLGCTLRDNLKAEEPDLLVIEMWLAPVAQRSDRVIITHMMLHGVVEGLAGCFGIPTIRPTSAQFRKHFCGVSSAAAPRRKGTKRTEKQRAADREATNRMVVQRAILLGYLPRNSDDWDKASAAAMYDWASFTHGRVRPRELVMFGEAPR